MARGGVAASKSGKQQKRVQDSETDEASSEDFVESTQEVAEDDVPNRNKRNLASRNTKKRAPRDSDASSAASGSEADTQNPRPKKIAAIQNGHALSPAKRRLSRRGDENSSGNDLLRRQSFNNLSRMRNPGGDSQESHEPSSQGTPRQASGSRIAGLNRVGGRNSLGGANGGIGGLLGAQNEGQASPAAPVSKEVMNANYEDWMKMATDNKINATNTWSFALIDYFHDMSLLRNSDSENSINFQKASCTLDGCIKIWTSRVDSVATETGKLLSGLAEDYNHDEDQSDEDEGDGSGAENAGPAKKKRGPSATKTLADSFEKIKAKNPDLEVKVDPLFKKTSADFDEGGASGILMNHLGCDRSMRVVFDASDTRLSRGADDEEEDDEEDDSNEDEGLKQIDLSKLRSEFLPDLSLLDGKAICPSMADFKFSANHNAALDLSFFNTPDDAPEADAPMQDGPPQDFFADEAGAPMNFDAGDYFDDEAGDAMDIDGGEGGEEQQANFARRPASGNPEPFDPSRGPNERELVMVMAGANGEQEGHFDYFDAAFTKNWAGPEHWKMRRPAVKKDDSAPKTKRKEKQPFSIDFEGDRAITTKELFAASATSTLMKRTAEDRKKNYTLPDDMHFSSAVLLRLFMKPKAMINMRSRGPRVYGRNGPQPGLGEEVDEHYWAEAAAANARGDAGDDDDDSNEPPIPFDTQFFQDDEGDLPDYQDDEVDMDIGGSGAGQTAQPGQTEDELLAATQGQSAKRARPDYVQYAKKAKRVDVKRLKDNIWKELDMGLGQVEGEQGVTKTFTNVISGLKRVYPADKLEEISTSFCFICLLHLANEQDLRLQPNSVKAKTADLEDAEGPSSVSSLFNLLVRREAEVDIGSDE